MRLKKEIAITETNGSYFAVDAGPKGDKFRAMVQMNETSMLIAEHLKNAETPEMITKALCAKYNVDHKEALSDVLSVIRQLAENGFLEQE